jgi:hypothetical protein
MPTRNTVGRLEIASPDSIKKATSAPFPSLRPRLGWNRCPRRLPPGVRTARHTNLTSLKLADPRSIGCLLFALRGRWPRGGAVCWNTHDLAPWSARMSRRELPAGPLGDLWAALSLFDNSAVRHNVDATPNCLESPARIYPSGRSPTSGQGEWHSPYDTSISLVEVLNERTLRIDPAASHAAGR